MERVLSYQKVDDYFKDLAKKHVDIKDYCGSSAEELASKITSVAGFKTPLLVFYDYSGKLEGNKQRTFNNRSLAFSILYTGVKADDFPGQRAAINNSEEIGLEVLSRINVQSKMPNHGWLYNNFDKNTATFDEVIAEGEDGFYGMEFHFELKTLEPLVVDPNKWSDGVLFCR
jgi:hypothetical protein